MSCGYLHAHAPPNTSAGSVPPGRPIARASGLVRLQAQTEVLTGGGKARADRPCNTSRVGTTGFRPPEGKDAPARDATLTEHCSGDWPRDAFPANRTSRVGSRRRRREAAQEAIPRNNMVKRLVDKEAAAQPNR